MTWVWVNSGSWWWTGRPGVLRFMGSQRIRHNWATGLNSAFKLNKEGDNIQPWCTRFPIWNQSVVPCPFLTVASWPAYRFLRRQVTLSVIPISLRIFQFVVIYAFKGFGVVSKAKVDVFSGTLLLFRWSTGCWQFKLWFLCLFWIQLEHLEIHSSRTVEAWLGEFWVLFC